MLTLSSNNRLNLRILLKRRVLGGGEGDRLCAGLMIRINYDNDRIKLDAYRTTGNKLWIVGCGFQ